MAGFASPDIPAYLTYLIVLLVGAIVAKSSVTSLLEPYPDRWAFLGTWSVFAAYLVLPVALFWFLDYTTAISDTSLFAALVVAVGYQQVFSGGVQGIVMPGQTPALWKPFETWVKKVADRIATKNKAYRDRFDEQVRSTIAASQAVFQQLESLVLDRTSQAAVIRQSLAAAPSDRHRVEILWRELRTIEPEQYGILARRAGLIGPWLFFRWFQKGQAKLVTTAVIVTVAVVIYGGWFRLHDPNIWRSYYQWRILKSNTSDRDRFRSRTYFASVFSSSDAQALAASAEPLLRELQYSALRTERAEDLLKLVVDCHSRKLDDVSLKGLIEALRTDNPDVRSRIHATLLHIVTVDFPDTVPSDVLRTWVPSKDDSMASVDDKVGLWRRWLDRHAGAGK